MRKVFAGIGLVFILSAVTFGLSLEELKSLYEKRQYFELRDKLSETKQLKNDEILFYRGAVENKFNRSEAAIKTLGKFIATKTAARDRSLLREAHTLLADSYIKTFRYADAAKTYEKILTQFSDGLGESERSSYKNVLGLWQGLADVKPQKTVFRGDSQIQGTREMVGLMAPVEIGGQQERFIFDTGANLSTIIESHAQKLGLRIIDVPFDVGSITGGMVKAKIGVAEKLKVGNVEFENVAFIVFPDKALYIEQIKYQINGILGFPVIAAMGEVTIDRSNQITIPVKPSNMKHANLALDGLTPLILGLHQGKRLTFSFDTGARTSSLYPPFFKAFEKEITDTGEKYSASVTGAGGSRQVNAYKMKDLKIEFAGKTPVFKTVEVFTEKTTGNSTFFYGNIGRDMIDQHERMTINFAAMSVSFDSLADKN